jgi:hypothetical protein
VQQRPAGVVPDAERKAWNLMRELTRQDFGGGGLEMKDDGSFRPSNVP